MSLSFVSGIEENTDEIGGRKERKAERKKT